MEKPLESLALLLIKYNKALSDIIYKTETQQSEFKNILVRLKRLGPKLINQLIEVIKNFEANNVLNKYAKMLLNDY